MNASKYKDFSNRLIESMKANGYAVSRSPSGICMRTLAKFAGASEQICRRYIRGEALPDYEKILRIAHHLNTAPGYLLFGDPVNTKSTVIEDDLLHYILSKSYHLYREETGNTDDYANFVLELIRDVREIDTSKENLEKIINLAVSSISSYKRQKKAV
ncbi:MAG: helix-turn-helix transcriptional regulator [Legionellaceae bacterium]|nr:helix-turn-helix transcriptional regulator [Legionellaceae bacterium]